MSRFFRFLPLFVVLCFAGCDRPKKEVVEQNTSETEKAPVEFVLDDALKSEVEAFGRRFEAAVAERNDDFLLAAFDFETMVFTNLGDQKIPAAMKRGMQAGLEQAGENAVQGLYAGDITFLEVQEFEGRPSIVLRNRPEGGGFDYLQYAVEKNDGEQEWRVVEAFPFSMGVKVSDLMRSLMLPALQQANKSVFQKLTTKNPVDMDWLMAMPKLQQIMQLARENKGEEALEIYDNLDDRFKKKKFAMQVHTMAAASTDDLDRYAKAMADFEAKFPNDPSISMQNIDAHFLKEDYPKARESLESLKAVVNDSYLDFYSGFIYLAEENYPEAEKAAKLWLKDHPEDAEGLSLLLEVGVATDKHDLTYEAINALEAHHQLDYRDGVRSEQVFAKFRNSEAGAKYLSKQLGE